MTTRDCLLVKRCLNKLSGYIRNQFVTDENLWRADAVDSCVQFEERKGKKEGKNESLKTPFFGKEN